MNKHFLIYSFFILLSLLFLSSCGSRKKLTYFQDAAVFSHTAHLNDSTHYEIRIRPNDNLLITVSSINPVAAEPFNTISFERGGVSTTTMLDWQGYLVDELGYINFPVLGKLYVSGMTKDQLVTTLEEKIETYFADPVVNVRFLNYSISILGEVAKPGLYTVSNEKITVPQALALAGDLTIYGERDNVLICRVENGKKNFYTMDLRNPAIFNSPYYYLQQNDIIYVAPNKAQAGRSAYNQTWSTVISISSLVVSIGTLVISILNNNK